MGARSAVGRFGMGRCCSRLARLVGLWMRVLPSANRGETTVSAEDDQGVRYRVFCDQLLPGGRRCLLRADHDVDCARRLCR